jgi:hypothetical protein
MPLSGVHLGTFKTEIEASYAYNLAALRYYGKDARLNEIDKESLELMKNFTIDFEKIESGDRCSSKYFGVSHRKSVNKWCAYIKDNGKQIFLGEFKHELEAALAVNEALLEFYGYKATPKLNQISQEEIDLLWSLE